MFLQALLRALNAVRYAHKHIVRVRGLVEPSYTHCLTLLELVEAFLQALNEAVRLV